MTKYHKLRNKLESIRGDADVALAVAAVVCSVHVHVQYFRIIIHLILLPVMKMKPLSYQIIIHPLHLISE